MWIVGDCFVATGKNVIASREMSNEYINNNFIVKFMAGSDLPDAKRQSPISRIRNTVAALLQRNNILPKWLIIIPENDIISGQNYSKQKDGPSMYFGSIIDWCMKEHDTMFQEFKKNLSAPAKKHNWPNIVWLAPTLHINCDNLNLRKKFTRALKKASQNYSNVITLDLSVNWNYEDTNYFIRCNQKFTLDGQEEFWKGTNKLLQYADTKAIRHGGKKLKEIFKEKEEPEEKLDESKKQDKDNSRENNLHVRNKWQNERSSYRPWKRRPYFNGNPYYQDRRFVIDRRRNNFSHNGRKLPSPPPLKSENTEDQEQFY